MSIGNLPTPNAVAQAAVEAKKVAQTVASKANYQNILSGLVVAVMGLLSWLVHDNSSYIEKLHKVMEQREEAMAEERKALRDEAKEERANAKEERGNTWREVVALRQTMAEALTQIQLARGEQKSLRGSVEKVEKGLGATQKTVSEVKKAVEGMDQ